MNAKVHYTLSISDILNTSGGFTKGSCNFWTLPLDIKIVKTTAGWVASRIDVSFHPNPQNVADKLSEI